MKNLFLTLLATLALTNCSNDNNEPPSNPADQLPPATTIGANKVGCLVNGEVFLPKGSNLFGAPILTCSYQYVDNGFEFGLGFSNNVILSRGITILTNKLEFAEGNTYMLKQELNINSAYAYYDVGLMYFGTNSIKTGELKITKLDQTNAIISGTFWYDAINAAGTVVQIRDGRFDMRYSQ